MKSMKWLKRIAIIVYFCFHTVTLAGELPSDDSRGRDDSHIYHVYDDIDLVSTLKFRYGLKPKTFVKYVYPQLEGDTDNPGVNYFNQLVSEMIEQQITEFRNRVSENQRFQKDTSAPKAKNNLYIDYDTSIVQSGDDHLISLRFTIQGFVGGMAHPYHYHRVINYNLDTGQSIALSDLFNDDVDYLTVIAQYVSQQLSKRLGENQFIPQGAVANPDNYRNWNIKPNGLLITFDDAQVAPSIQGAQTLLIPYSILKNIMWADSPLAACVKNKWKCQRHHVLTGGFIDEV